MKYTISWINVVNKDSIVDIVNRLLSGRLRSCGSMCSGDKRFCSPPKHPDWLWGPTSCLLIEYHVLFGLMVK